MTPKHRSEHTERGELSSLSSTLPLVKAAFRTQMKPKSFSISRVFTAFLF
jgi:hypothetical protein